MIFFAFTVAYILFFLTSEVFRLFWEWIQVTIRWYRVHQFFITRYQFINSSIFINFSWTATYLTSSRWSLFC